MIKKTTKTALVAVVLGSLNLVFAAPAEAAAAGAPCRFTSITDPTVENGQTQVGQINAGPIAALAPGATVTITCTIQVGSANSTHAGTDSSAKVSSKATPQVAAIPPTSNDAPNTVSYVSPEGQPVYMCTEINIDGTTYYWDATTATQGPAGNGPVTPDRLSTEATAACREAISQELVPQPVQDILEGLDPAICAIIIANVPDVPPVLDVDEEGDIRVADVLVWDCPPYES